MEKESEKQNGKEIKAIEIHQAQGGIRQQQAV